MDCTGKVDGVFRKLRKGAPAKDQRKPKDDHDADSENPMAAAWNAATREHQYRFLDRYWVKMIDVRNERDNARRTAKQAAERVGTETPSPEAISSAGSPTTASTSLTISGAPVLTPSLLSQDSCAVPREFAYFEAAGSE